MLEYWLDDGWYVGRLKEVPGVFSQGETLAELEHNIRDAYQLIKEDALGVDSQLIQSQPSFAADSSIYVNPLAGAC